MIVHELNENVGENAIEHLIKTAPDGIGIVELWTAYEISMWQGYGQIVYLDSNGDWHIDDLGHCSCYGPAEDGWNRITYTKEQVIHLLKEDAKKDYEDGDMAKLLLKELE